MSVRRKAAMPRIHLARPPGLRVYADGASDAELHAIAVEMKTVTDSLGEFATRAQKDLRGFDGRLRELEQRYARRGGPSAPAATNFMAALDDDALRDALVGAAKHGKARFAVKAAILSSPPSGVVPPAERRPDIVASVQRALRVRDLLVVTPTSSASVEFVQETLMTNGADVVSEGAQKPETTFTFSLETAPVRTIAHWTQASKQVLDDVARLSSFLDTRMRYGVQLAEDNQLLLGDGTGQNLTGLVPAATAFAPPAGIDLSTMADQIGAAIAQLRASDHEPDGVVLHPSDWQKISQEKGSDGHYLVPGGPFSTAAPVLFSKRVALSTAMTEDEFLVGQFAIGAEAFEREETQVELSTEDRDNFVKNLVTIRAEERLALAVYRPEAFVTGDFGIIT